MVPVLAYLNKMGGGGGDQSENIKNLVENYKANALIFGMKHRVDF